MRNTSAATPLLVAPLLGLVFAACSSSPREASSASPSSGLPGAEPATSAVVAASASAAATPSSARLTIDPAKAKRAEEDAARCLADPRCPATDAERLFTEALDHGSTASCELFYAGAIVTKDWSRARVCFERRFVSLTCNGSSPDADRLILATMLLDGQGGPRAPTRVETLLHGCYEDVSAKWLSDELQTRGEGAAPVDFCMDVGGTTLSMIGCGRMEVEESRMEVALARKSLAARFGDDVLKAEEAAASAFAAYLAADVESRTYPFQMGTMAPLISLGVDSGQNRAYATYLRDVSALRPEGPAAPLDAKAKAAAVKTEADTLADVLKNADDPPWRALIQRSETAFQSFVKAAAAFETVALGTAGADDAVARLSTARVERLNAHLPE